MNKFVKAVTGLLATVTLVAGLSIGTVFAAASDPNEPNDTSKKATSITLGKTYKGEIGDLDRFHKTGKVEEDWFKFKATAGMAYKITFKGYKARFKDTTLIISGFAPGTPIDSEENRYGSDSLSTLMSQNDSDTAEVIVKKSGTYYIKVWNFFNYKSKLKDTTYSITVKEGIAPIIMQLNQSVDATLVCGQAARLGLNTTTDISGSLVSSDKSIAEVQTDGKVHAKQAGFAEIKFTSSNGLVAKVNLQVLYKDVKNPKEFWYKPTNYLTNKNVVKGYDKQTKFKPGNDCTRAQMVTFLWRLAGSPAPTSTSCNFTDVKKSDYYYKAVLWAVEKGITTGTSKTKFSPKGVCTRAQTVTFLWRMAGQPSVGSAKNPFKDVKQSDYFYNAVIWASNKKIVAGYKDGTFKPKGKCLRRQMVTFLYKYDNNIK